MSPPRRRSARLASASAVKKRATPDLASVAERDETPSRRSTKRANEDTSVQSSMPEPTTPVSSALKPPRSEMHPSRFHCSTGAPSSALRLGFADIPKEGRATNGQDRTPSKINGIPNSSFTFGLPNDGGEETESASDDQRMLNEIRDQVAKIKAELVAQREAEGRSGIADRQFAKPKGSLGRFSAAHMAEFKKMDSIEGHASAWRAQDGRFTPVKALKRTPSKANLDATQTSQRRDGLPRSVGRVDQEATSSARSKPSLKRKSSAANLDNDRDTRTVMKRQNTNPIPGKSSTPGRAPPSASVAKRVKRQQDDDAATTRPQSLVVSPNKPSSVFSRLASPRKPPVAPAPAHSKPSIEMTSSPSKTNLQFTTSQAEEMKRRIISPRSFSKVKSILRGSKNSSQDGMSAIPAPQPSQTPDAPRFNKEPPPIPLTTPRRQLTKRVTFTPDVVTAINAQNSPSPQRASNLKLRPALRAIDTHDAALDEVIAQSSSSHSLYPDLSPLKHLVGSESRRSVSASPSRTGTFTFRSDHTIKFDDSSSSGFGVSPGQSSVRHVGGPAGPKNLPGSFPVPASPSSHPDKENKDPTPIKLLAGTAHGMQNKKRHRASSDDDDFDSSRAAKKRKNDNVPEGQELLAPRLVKSGLGRATKTYGFTRTPRKPVSQRTPGRNAVGTPATASPTKKKTGGLSMSRLNMLAQPKNRA